MTFCTEIEKAIVKYIWKHKKTLHSQSNSEQKKSNTGGITIPNFKLYYRAITVKTAWYFTKTDRKTNGSENKIQT
jgi:hypothetical protein